MKTFKLAAFTVAQLLLISGVAFADISGRWTCDFNLGGSGSYPQDFILTDSGGSVVGIQVYPGGNSKFADVTGSSSGASFTLKTVYTGGGYYADIVGTASGTTMSGTWSNNSQAGGFTCSRIGNAPGGSSTPIPTGGKKPTAINIFCNRTGVGLSTADCAVTLADAGAPPRSAPTGAVDLVATNGFFPANASCFPQQTQYSPGIASCKVQFAIPFGFPIGIAFPIDATYGGDSVFEGSSTSHATIQAGCIGDATNPCSGAVAMTFADVPQIVKNALKAVFECGNAATTGQVVARSPFGKIGKCVGKIAGEAKLGEILGNLNLTQMQDLAKAIKISDAKLDPLLRAISGLDDAKYTQDLQNAINDEQKINELMRKIIKDQTKEQINNLRTTGRAAKPIVVKLGSVDFSVKNNSVKPVNLKLTKQAAKLVQALKKAGKGDIDVTLNMKGKRDKGPKKPFNKTFTVRTGLN